MKHVYTWQQCAKPTSLLTDQGHGSPLQTITHTKSHHHYCSQLSRNSYPISVSCSLIMCSTYPQIYNDLPTLTSVSIVPKRVKFGFILAYLMTPNPRWDKLLRRIQTGPLKFHSGIWADDPYKTISDFQLIVSWKKIIALFPMKCLIQFVIDILSIST